MGCSFGQPFCFAVLSACLRRRYFSRVASPPLMCRSLLFVSSTRRTLLYSGGLEVLSLWLTSLCTVLLLIPNFCAAALTVAFRSIMYRARIAARSSVDSFNLKPPCVFDAKKLW